MIKTCIFHKLPVQETHFLEFPNCCTFLPEAKLSCFREYSKKPQMSISNY